MAINFKQVIVVRRDLKMRRGKEISQASHASMAFLSERIKIADKNWQMLSLSHGQREWLYGNSAKITCRVDSEAELLEIYQKAKALNIEVHLITDSGKTEFHGIPTKTALAIGPDDVDKIDQVTGHLELY